MPTWCTAQEPVQLQYVDLFEVHGGISVKQQMPPYSEAFRGYGLNKQQHAWHAAALGFTFKVGEQCCKLASSAVCLLVAGSVSVTLRDSLQQMQSMMFCGVHSLVVRLVLVTLQVPALPYGPACMRAWCFSAESSLYVQHPSWHTCTCCC